MANQKLQKFKRRLVREILDKTLYISAAVEVANSITNFATNKSVLSFASGATGALDVFAKFVGRTSDDYFNTNQGWENLINASTQQALHDIILPILDQFPFNIINFYYQDNHSLAKIYTLPNGKTLGRDSYGFWFYPEEGSKEELLKFLYEETFKSIGSQVFSITEKENQGRYGWETHTKFILKPETLTSIKSTTAIKHLNHIKQATDKNIHRSVMFVGVPGSGKSTIASTIINELGFRTLRFKYNSQKTDLPSIESIIDALGVEALILDDLDTVENSVNLLGFLERLHTKLKLTISIVNNTSIFFAAILRPARTDEIITINKLDPEVCKAVLGDKLKSHYSKVKGWPIAYVAELKQRYNINPKISVATEIKELDARVKKQIKALKEPSGPN